MKRPVYELAPAWAGEPTQHRKRPAYEITVIQMPCTDECVVAGPEELEALRDPDSFMGDVLSRNAAALSLPYLSDN